MHAHELADLAALAAVHGEQLIAADAATMDRMLSVYWRASRCRLDRWCRTLALVAKHSERQSWTDYEIGAVEEILVSDLVTRVVAAIATAHDERLSANESTPVARNIFTAHFDIRQRAIGLAIAPHRSANQAKDFLALRRQCERWTDLLLAYLAPHAKVDAFAADASRVGDFAFDAREHLRSGSSSDMAVTMIIAGMRSSLGPIKAGRTLNTDLNQEIATAIVSGFDPTFFDAHGHLQSAWLERIRRIPDDAPLDSDTAWQLSPHARHDVPRPARWRWWQARKKMPVRLRRFAAASPRADARAQRPHFFHLRGQ